VAVDTITGQNLAAVGSPYSGPVSGLQWQYIYPGTNSVNIAVSSDNWFLVGGPGNDAIQAFGGYNVLDGGTGSNFLTGGSGTDTFFVNDINPSTNTWTTVNNFHNDDDVTLFGIDPGKDILQWVDNQGASGFTGLTLHAFSSNGPTASLTMVGYNAADLSNGTLSVQFGTESNGTPFMHIVGV
jgi:serralysin